MPIQVSLEDALRTLIIGLPAFAALTPLPSVRPYKLAETDFKVGSGARGVIVECPDETNQESFDEVGQGVSAKASVECVAETLADAWTVAETIRLNGGSPGTGLAGFSGTIAGLVIQRISVNKTMKGFEPYYDGSDEGFYYVRREITVDYQLQD